MFLVVVVVDRTGLWGEGVAARTDKEGLAALIVAEKVGQQVLAATRKTMHGHNIREWAWLLRVPRD
jgi:hypothetical protein